MATEPPSSALPPGDFKSPLTSPQTSPAPHTTHLQLEEGTNHFLPRDSDLYRLEVRPRPMGGDGAGPGQGEGPIEPTGAQSYTWQPNEAGDTHHQSSHWTHPFDCFRSLGNPETTPVSHQYPVQSEGNPEALPVTHLYTDQLEGCKPWDHHGECPQDFALMFPAGVYSTGSHLSESHYTLQCLNPQDDQDQTQHALYPKPLYSYSILIFLALRHSRTGCLPVNEIYRFMTQHFPFFKTAPDGWKNSVRHNLSLNKCFEKVENRSGAGGWAGGGARGGAGTGASRKGCLWALNPARVEKMMEELHKWRRKDPLTVRKSMAHPEELDCLLSDWPERRRLGLSHFPRGGTPSFQRHPFLPPPMPTGPDHAQRYTLQGPAVGRRPSRLLQSPGCFTYHPPNRLEPPLPGHSTLTHGAALLTDPCGSRNATEMLMEGALGSDVDTLKPSITQLPLHGKLWEEVRDDSLALDPPAAATPLSTCPPTPGPSLPDGYRGNCTSTGEKEEQNLIHLHVSATFDPSVGGASCLPASGDTAITLL